MEILILWILLGVIGYFIGKPKGYGALGFFIGFSVPVVGLIVVAVLPDRQKAKSGTACCQCGCKSAQ
jgi:hypothetical protein